MRSHRSIIWRVSLLYAALTVASLAVLLLLLNDFLPSGSVAALRTEKEGKAQEAATLVIPYLSDSGGDLHPGSLHELGAPLSRLVDSRVTIISPNGKALADSAMDLSAYDSSLTSDYDFQSDTYLLRARLGNVESSLRKTFRSDYSQVLYTAAPVMKDGNVIGVIKLETPVTGSTLSVSPVLVWWAVWGLVVGLSALVAIWLVGRHFSRSGVSLKAVVEGSVRLERGDLDYRVPTGAHDETRQMTDAFNSMADTLQVVIGRLSSERDTLSAVLATMADGVIVTDRTGHLSMLNPAARELLGIRTERAEGLRLVELVRDNEIHQAITRCQEQKTRQQTEISLIFPRRHLSAIATPLDNEGGVLLTLHDLTRMRQVETSQREFVSNVSHELRNPMASIKAMVETLESGAVNDPKVALDFLGRMRGDVDRINGLVDDLLELSRMESGQFRVEAEPIALGPIVQGVKRQFSETAASQEVEIEISLADDLPLMMADGEKLTQIFVNLVENSLKFTPAGGRISIHALPYGDWVQIVLKDTGIGVAPQHLPHLFERFYKVNRSRRDSGTGLGLSIVKQLVEAHGGQITVESREGEGCSFTFTVPQVG